MIPSTFKSGSLLEHVLWFIVVPFCHLSQHVEMAPVTVNFSLLSIPCTQKRNVLHTNMVAPLMVDTTDNNNGGSPSHQLLTPHNVSFKINSTSINNLLEAERNGHRNTAFTPY